MSDTSDYSRSWGGAALGARLRRVSERLDRDSTRVYAAQGVAFEQRWFGVLNQLVLNGPMSVGDIAAALRITHVSVSQSSRSLEKAGIIGSQPDAEDGRRRNLSLTPTGEALVAQLRPMWGAFSDAAVELNDEAADTVAALDRLEDALARKSLFDRISERISAVSKSD
jgi:DNA-binding MarR family transcriptional regulator